MSPEKVGARKNGEKDEVEVDNAETKELPPGWTVDVKIRKTKGSRTRKDRYYKDPVTGCIFLSLKDVWRYLKTGEVGRLAIKPKDMGVGEMRGVNVPVANKSEEIECDENASSREEKSESKEPMTTVSTPVTRSSLRKRALENGSEGPKTRSKSNEKSESPLLPRRASKRLAGVDVDVRPLPLPEPKTRRPVTARRATQLETSTAVDLATLKKHDAKQVKPIALSEARFSTSKERAGEVDADNKPVEKQEVPVILPVKEGCKNVNEEDAEMGADEKHELPIVLTPVDPKEHDKEIEMDNRSNNKQASPTILTPVGPTTYSSGVKTDNNPPDESQNPPIFVSPLSFEIEKDNSLPLGGIKTDTKPEAPVDFSLDDLWTDPCIEFAVKTLTGAIPIENSAKADNFPSTSLPELPLEELWTDPCIEFAVKTLTGAIPVGEDLCIQDYPQNHPTNSSHTITENFSLPDICVNNFCQTEVLSKHYETTGNNKQQDLAAPTTSSNH